MSGSALYFKNIAKAMVTLTNFWKIPTENETELVINAFQGYGWH